MLSQSGKYMSTEEIWNEAQCPNISRGKGNTHYKIITSIKDMGESAHVSAPELSEFQTLTESTDWNECKLGNLWERYLSQ